jgi:nitrate/nitrite-specific signal transduction histidine kinase
MLPAEHSGSVFSIGSISVVVGLGFSLLLSNLLVKPVRRIMEATQKISEGDYDVEISTQSSDELGDLTSDFNQMAKKLKSYHDLNIDQILAEKILFFLHREKMERASMAARHLAESYSLEKNWREMKSIFQESLPRGVPLR